MARDVVVNSKAGTYDPKRPAVVVLLDVDTAIVPTTLLVSCAKASTASSID